MRYYHHHLIIAAAINTGAVAGAWLWFGYHPSLIYLTLTGGLFYGIREVVQWYNKKWWDALGFWYPVNVSLAMFTMFAIIFYTGA